MRTKVVLSAVLLGCGVIGLATWLNRAVIPINNGALPETIPAPSKGFITQKSTRPPQAPSRMDRLAIPEKSALSLAVRSECDRIIAELQSPEESVWRGALEQAKQQDRPIIARLRQVADQTEDPAQKAAILDAIDFINLPSITDYVAGQKAMRAAEGLPDPPASLTNRWTGKPFIQPPASH